MSITQLFDKTIDIYRLGDTEGTDDNESWAVHLADEDCQIQPLDDAFAEGLDEGSYSKDFVMFCSVIDVKQGDKIIDGTDEYLVAGVESYSFQGCSHMELRIRLTQ